MRFGRRHPLTSMMGVVVIAAVTCSIIWMMAPKPPVPAALARFDPMVAEAVNNAVARVRWLPFSAGRWMDLAMIYEANEVPELALECYQRVLAAHEDDPRAWYRAACVRARLGDVAAAVETMSRSIAIKPDHAPSHWRQGMWRLDQGEIELAEAAFERAIKLESNNRAAWAGKALCRLQQNKGAEATTILEGLVNKHSDDRYLHGLLAAAYRQSGRNEEARLHTRIAGESEAQWDEPWTREMEQWRTGIDSTLSAAADLHNAGQFKAVVNLLEPLQPRFPNHVGLLYGLGAAYAEVGRIDEAIALLEKARSRDPNYYLVYTGLATAWYRKGDLAKALSFIDRGIELNGRAANLHQVRGSVLHELRRDREAIEAFEREAANNPSNLMVLVFQGKTELGVGDWAAARTTFQRVIDRDSTSATALVGLAMANIQLDQLADAKATLQRAMKVNPKEPGLDEAQRMLQQRSARMPSEGGS